MTHNNSVTLHGFTHSKETQLIKGFRYLFTERIHGTRNEYIQFRANFINIINNTIRIDYHDEYIKTNHKKCIVSMPLNWIVKTETLDQITREKMRLPPEIMDIIDSYL